MRVVAGLVKCVFLSVFLFSGSISAQLINDGELVKYIEVTGSAETKVVPDIITLSFSIKEYKRGKEVIPIKVLETKLNEILNRLQIPDSSLFVDNIYGRDVKIRRKSYELRSSKSYLLIVKNISQIDSLIEALSEIRVNSVSIKDLANSRITEHRIKLKVAAIKAAKMKANQLLNAVDEKLGELIFVEELQPEKTRWTNPASNSNVYYYNRVSSTGSTIKKIELRYEIKARFRIL